MLAAGVNNVRGRSTRGPIAARENDAMILQAVSAEPDLYFFFSHYVPKNQSLDCAKDTAKFGLDAR